MDRKEFIRIAGTTLGGYLLLPKFLTALPNLNNSDLNQGRNILVFLQLNGGNDSLNTFIPVTDPAYYAIRGNLAIQKDLTLNAGNGMAWHPSLKGLHEIQQAGHLTLIQNVGYPNPSRSHFRAMEIWQTASDHDKYLSEGWLGRYLDAHCQPNEILGALNIDTTDSLALRGKEAHSLSMQDPQRYEKMLKGLPVQEAGQETNNPNLDFVRKLSLSSLEGKDEINAALKRAESYSFDFPATRLGKNLQWISKLILGNLETSVYYTGMSGFDTHINQLQVQRTRFEEISGAVLAFYHQLKNAAILDRVTLVIFSEFGRRVAPNGSGTDHGKAGSLILIGGKNKGRLLGNNPDLINLDQGDLKFEMDFRSIYASLLKEKFSINPAQLGIVQTPLTNIF